MDPEVLQAIINTPAEGEDEFLKTLKSQGVSDEEKINAAIAHFRVQKGMKDLVDDATMSAVAKAAGYEGTAKAVTSKEGDEDKDKDKDDPKSKRPAFLDKKKGKVGKSIDLSGLDDAARAQMEAVFKSHDSALAKANELETVVKTLSTTVGELKDDALVQQYVAKAERDYSHLPIETKELSLILKSANDMGPEYAKSLDGVLGKVNEMVQKSALLTTMGAVHMQKSGGAWDKITTIAKSMVRKSIENGVSISDPKAIDIVLKSDEGKALYREYLQDNPKQRAEIY